MTTKALVVATAVAVTVAGLTSTAQAQLETVIPLQRDPRGGLTCPANYEARGNACVSILAGRGAPGSFDRGYGSYRYRDDYFDAPQLPKAPRRQHRDDYDEGRTRVQPRLDYRGELKCPRNYVVRGGVCVSLW